MSYKACFDVMALSNIDYSYFIKPEKIKSNQLFHIERYCDYAILEYIAIPKNINTHLINDIVVIAVGNEIINVPFEIIKNHSKTHTSNKYTYFVLSDFIKFKIPIVAIMYHEIFIKLISSIDFTFKLYFNNSYLKSEGSMKITNTNYCESIINYGTYEIKNEFEISVRKIPVKVYLSLKPKKYMVHIKVYDEDLCIYYFSSKSNGIFYHEIKDIDPYVGANKRVFVKLDGINETDEINGFLYLGYNNILEIGSGIINKII